MRAGNIEIAPLGSGDLDKVATLYHAIWHETHAPYQDARIAESRDLTFFKSRLRRWLENTVVAWNASTPAGFSSWHANSLVALFIAPQFRKAGLGTKLLEMAESKMRQTEAPHLTLDCVCANAAGRKFYEGNGWRVFKTAELRDDIYRDIVTPHWLMVK